MEKYTDAELLIIAFEAADVITASGEVGEDPEFTPIG